MIKQKNILILFVLILFIALSTNVTFGQLGRNTAPTEKQLYAKSFLNKKAPEIVIEKWLSEKPKYEGKFVMIDFWATWCPPCRRVIPELNKFSEKYKDDLIVIGITSETEAIVKMMKSPIINYYVGLDSKERMLKQIEIEGIPHVILIDPNGIVRWEGFPTQKGYELTDKVVANIIKKYKK